MTCCSATRAPRSSWRPPTNDNVVFRAALRAVAIDFSAAEVELTQNQVERLGVWQATRANSLFTPPATVGDIATTAVELFTASMQYIDLFSRLILCNRPAAAPNADELLGKVTDTGTPIPPPHETEQLYRRLFGWSTTS
jgi:hypothetical protein